MNIAPGTRIARYDVQELLGSGGMGEVYLARDVTLERKVALKILPATSGDDEHRIERFVQEAKSASALTHPNIVTIYDAGAEGDVHFIAMELVDGVTLRRRAAGARLGVADALAIASQVASALEAAHGAGIVHRDIKPENVMIRADGLVKVLDFGLAKLALDPAAATETRTRYQTSGGLLVGTTRYMSPEQARGQTVDARTDIWSLGVLFYEMLSGRAPFDAPTTTDTLAAIVAKDAAPLQDLALDAQTTSDLQWIVAKALAKDRDERYQTAKDVLIDLRRLQRMVHGSDGRGTVASPLPAAGPGVARATKRLSTPVTIALATIAVAGLALIAYWLATRPDSSASPGGAAFSRTSIRRVTSNGRATYAAIAPDGQYVVHVFGTMGQQTLQLRHLATGSDKEVLPGAKDPFTALGFSGDGSYIDYSRFGDEAGGIASRVPVLGGVPLVLGKDVDSAVTFSPDGRQLAYVRGRPREFEADLVVASAAGGSERRLITRGIDLVFPAAQRALAIGRTNIAWGPAWSPDGASIAIAVNPAQSSAGRWELRLVRVADGTERVLAATHWSSVGAMAWLPDGSGLVVCAADEEPFAPHQLWFVSHPRGEIRRITSDLNDYQGVSVTRDGRTIATVSSERRGAIWIATPGAPGSEREIPSDRLDGTRGMAWTGDGRLVYTSAASGQSHVWIMNADGSGRRQLTTGQSPAKLPAVSSDDRFVAFSREQDGTHRIWRVALDGGAETPLSPGPGDVYPSYAPDGRTLFYANLAGGVWRIAADGGPAAPVLDYLAVQPVLSPDGTHLAFKYVDDSKGRTRPVIAIARATGGPPVQMFEVPSVLYSQVVRWRPDGALTYLTTEEGGRNLRVQPLDGSASTQITQFTSGLIWDYAWSRDGSRLALSRGTTTSDVVLITDER